MDSVSPARPGSEGASAWRAMAPSKLERRVTLLLVTFLLFFPKGGVKLAGVPLTWGYVALAAVSLSLPLALLLGRSWKISRQRLLLALALVPFQFVVWLSFLFNGVTGMGFTISMLVSFFFVPHVFLLVLGPPLDRLDLSHLFRLVRAGVLFVAAYGIFLFFFKLTTGSFVEIPLLTVNTGDLGELDDKYIDRGGIFKLISTYNNGNIYGVCLLMLLPLYAWLERRTVPNLVVKFSLLLTLSRTVWLGLLAFELLHRLYVRPLTVRALGLLAGSVLVVVGGVLTALRLMGLQTAFLFDRNLGGRIVQLQVLDEATILPGISFEHILEMVYLSILENFGLVGLATFLVAMSAPLLLFLFRAVPHAATEYKRSLAAGLMVYLFVALSDGALLFIPVMAFFWFVVTLLVSPNPSFASIAPSPPAAAPARSGSARPRFAPVTPAALPLLLVLAGCDLPTSGERSEGTVEIVNFDREGYALVRFDVQGDPIDAHGGQIDRFGDLYYLYGETYGCGFQWHRLEPVPFCGFRVYSSPNLVDWTDRGLLFDVSGWEPWQSRCHWWSNGCFRPHVLHNRETGRYVLWVNVYDPPVSYYVLESETPVGPFVERGVPRLAFNMDAPPKLVNNGDHNLFVDDDGTGYIIYTEWRESQGDLVIERLTPDYLSGTGEFVRLGTSHSESPALFKREGRYYVTASTPPNAAYGRSATSYFTASSPLGTWSSPTRISEDSCGGQPFHVSRFPTPDGGEWYLYQSDLWLNSDGVEAGDLNQAPAALYWGPLNFDRSGRIRPITCRRSYSVPAVVASPPAGGGEAYRLTCDIGVADPAGTLSREVRFRAGRTGRLREVVVNAYQRDEPTGPLQIELREGSGADSRVIARRSVPPRGAFWQDEPEIAWTARRVVLMTDVQVREGETYSVRLSADLTRGCYGTASGEGAGAMGGESFVSLDGGRTWTTEAPRRIRFSVRVDAP
jgi:hypothetical protein